MKPKRKHGDDKGAIEIIEEAFHLLRGAPLRTIASYCVGSLPFILALLYFWADMSKSAFARERLPGSAFVLSLLFIWMKTWQTLYSRLLWVEVSGETPVRWNLKRFLRVAMRQTILQPSGLFMLPVALLVTVPFGWTYAAYQNITVLDNGDERAVRSLVGRAVAMARLWQKQNHLLIWAISPYLLMIVAAFFLVLIQFVPTVGSVSLFIVAYFWYVLLILSMVLNPFGVIVAANIASAIIFLPFLLRALTGAQIAFLRGGSMLNSTFFAVVCGLAYLCLDPLVKAAYVLRCFYGESLSTGEDLRVELKRFTASGEGERVEPKRRVGAARLTIVLVILGTVVFSSGRAIAAPIGQPAKEISNLSVSSSELDRALERELQGREYAWRMPRLKRPETEEEEGLFAAFARGAVDTLADWGEAILRWGDPIFRWIDRFIKWLRELRDVEEPVKPGLMELSPTLRLILYLLVAGLLCVAGIMLWRILKQWRVEPHEIVAEAVRARPDLEDESTTADWLPEDDWLALARELIEKGELRLALRAVFLATLANLGRREMIQIARFKSNRDYKNELARRAHAQPETLDIFSNSVSIYESVWYGMHAAGRESVDSIIANEGRLSANGG
ncbi:hypothetical protein HZA56_04545 [Candidatus Poribacteria bacterium]|nr:hypothetical protein [Candidatus Poribacteria bacterium]